VKQADQYAARAVELLRRAIENGFQNLEQLKHDPELDALRQRDDFKKLLAELQKK
jgi:hypothetical protein